MKRLIFILALCCHFLISLAAPSGVRTDSLERLLSAMPHDSLRLHTIQSITRMEQTPPKCIYYSNMLLKEAVAQDNPTYAGIALYFQVIYYYNQNELDSVIQKIQPNNTNILSNPQTLCVKKESSFTSLCS